MSDPVTNMEIEDVLSSIRRLVSEDSRTRHPKPQDHQPERLVLTPAHRVVEQAEDDVPEAEVSEEASAPVEAPVLLTNPTVSEPVVEQAAAPAEEETAEPVAQAQPAPEPDASAEDAYARLVSVEAAPSEEPAEAAEVAELEDLSISSLRDEATPLMAFARKLAEAGERMEREQEDESLAAPATVADPDPAPQPEAAEAEPEAVVEVDPTPEPIADETRDAVQADESFTEEEDEAVSATDILGQLVEQEVSRVFSGAFEDALDDAEDDTPDEADAALDTNAAEETKPVDPFEALVSGTFIPSRQAAAEEAATEPEPEAEPDAAPAETLEGKIAALEKMVAGQSGEWDADAAEEPAFVHRPAKAMAWQDHNPEEQDADAEPEATAAPEEPEALEFEDVTEPEAETPAAEVVEQVAPSTEEALPAIDETSLRLMVSEIVRQELQGALGERITRNVRKLVRREIHRAMVSQDFD